MPTEDQLHQWQNQNKKTASRLTAGANESKQIHCAKCGQYATKLEIMAGEAEYYRQKNGMWLCSCCQTQIAEWYNEKDYKRNCSS